MCAAEVDRQARAVVLADRRHLARGDQIADQVLDQPGEDLPVPLGLEAGEDPLMVLAGDQDALGVGGDGEAQDVGALARSSVSAEWGPSASGPVAAVSAALGGFTVAAARRRCGTRASARAG